MRNEGPVSRGDPFCFPLVSPDMLNQLDPCQGSSWNPLLTKSVFSARLSSDFSISLTWVPHRIGKLHLGWIEIASGHEWVPPAQ
jgi:hypothetical protein